MGWVSRRWEVDHGGLSGGAHREPQEQRAAPLLCVGRSVTRDRPSTYVIYLGAGINGKRRVEQHATPIPLGPTPAKDVVFEDVCSRPRRTSFSPNISARGSSRIEKPR